MAIEQHFTAADMIFIGEDKTLIWKMWEYDEDGVTKIPLNVSGWELRFDVRKSDKAGDPPAITKSTTTGGIVITGTFDTNPVQNTQRVELTLTDEDTNALKPMTYRYALKRMTTGGEAILAFGNFVLRQAAVR